MTASTRDNDRVAERPSDGEAQAASMPYTPAATAGSGPRSSRNSCSSPIRPSSLLVLDEYVAAWIQEHAGLKLRLYPARTSVYVGYLELVQAWAPMLGLAVHEVEQLIFAAEARTRPRNDWLLEDPS